MAAPVVKLKPDKEPAGPLIRLSRGENGISFVVGTVDKSGAEDFRTQAEHQDYDAALKDATERAQRVRLPLKNETGVTDRPAERTPPTATKKHSNRNAGSKPTPTFAELEKQFDELPRLADGFALPDVGDRLKTVDLVEIHKRASLMHQLARTGLLEDHAKRHGDSRDHACTYTQKIHDQIQGQLAEFVMRTPSSR